MKKKLVQLLAILSAGAFLTGCAGGNAPSNVSSENGSGQEQQTEPALAADEKVTLRFAWWGGDERTTATLEVIKQFTKLYPNVTIEAEYGSSDGYHDKLSTQLAAGTAADIVQIDPETFPTYVYSGNNYFIDYMDYGFDLSNFDEAYISLPINGRYDKKQLGLPSGIAGPTMLVNQELADAIGIDFTQDYTWEDLIAWGRLVREYDESMYLLCTNKDYITNLVVYNYAKQLTGTTIFDQDSGTMNLTEEQLYEVFLLVERLYEEEVAAPASYTAAYTGDSLQSDPNWINGKYVSTLSYISTMDVMIAANPDAVYSIGNLPIMEGAKNNGWSANCPQVFAITSTCEYPEIAAAFMDYFFNNETAMETLACTRSVPPTARAREICEEKGSLSTLAMEAADIAAAMGGVTSDSIASSQEGKQIVTDAVEMIGYGASSPEDVASNTYNLLTGLLK